MSTNRVEAPSWSGYALVVAVSNYRSVTPLPSAILNDANEIAATLTSSSHCGYDSANVKLLLDSDATLEKIRTELAWLAANAGEDDSVVIYFSGHGVRFGSLGAYEYALVPVDCDLTRLRCTCLAETVLSEALKQVKSARLLVLLDACHSGGAIAFKGVADQTGVEIGWDDKSLQQLAEGKGRVAIASSRSTETSLVLPGSRNSVFTEHLLEALKGEASSNGDDYIRVFQIFEHVAASVSSATGDRQHPIFAAKDVENNFPVALNISRGKAIIRSRVDGANTVFDWDELGRILPEIYPLGPLDQEVWARAGGDVSRLKLLQSGRTNWFSSLVLLRLGGGGDVTRQSLIETALSDFPNHEGLKKLLY